VETLRIIFRTLLLLLFIASIPHVFFKEEAQANSPIIVPNDYPTIQEAIDYASSGDKIIIKPGVYRECIKIDKPLKIIGSGNSLTIIEGTGLSHTVEIPQGVVNVTLQGFTISTTTPSPWAGIYIRGLYNNIIGNVILNHKFGIKIYDSHGNVLRNNSMRANRFNLYVWGIPLFHFINDIDPSNLVNGKPVYYLINKHNLTVPSDAGYVAIINSTNVVVKDLNLTNNLSAVLLVHTNYTLIRNIKGAWNERGIYLISSHNNEIINNHLFGNDWSGITLISSTNNLISGNLIHNHVHGIVLSHTDTVLPNLYSNNNLLTNNVITNNTYGIRLDKASYNKITQNTLVNNHEAIALQSSSNNTFYHNNFLENVNAVFIKTSHNSWDNNEEGNFWSDYRGIDSDKDGIGDTPYVLDAKNQDNHPLMGSFYTLPLQKHSINIISNSTIEAFQYSTFNKILQIYTSKKNPTQNYGFTRICIPRQLNVTSLKIIVNETQTLLAYRFSISHFIIKDNSTHKWLYIVYSTNFPGEINVTKAELPSTLFLSLLLFLVLFAANIIKRRLLY
jgi:parallel beta-helix repeat protein